MKVAEKWIRELDLEKHPEGGYFKEVYRSPEVIGSLPGRYSGERVFSTSIYYLLEGDQFSAFHRIQSDEIWHFYEGCHLLIYIIDGKGHLEKVTLGRDITNGQKLQHVIERGQWFAARPSDRNSFSLVGCTVAPGFDFRDFELGESERLFKKYPAHRKLILELSKNTP